MSAHLKLRLHVSEPWDFARLTGCDELTGWTIDHLADEAGIVSDEWEITLDEGFDYHERRYARLLVSPRYVGEHLSRMADAIAGFPVRIAHRDGLGGWHYAFTGMLSVLREPEKTEQKQTDV